MRVAYDVSVLGMSVHSNTARTGVFRAVEGLAIGLAASRECELRLVVGGGEFLAVSGAIDYLDATPELSGVPFSPMGVRQRAFRVLAGMVAKQARDRRAARGALEAAVRGGCRRAYRWLARTRHPLPRHELNGIDLLHVPYGVLPPRDEAAYSRVLTVYDLIGVRFPDWCEPHVQAHVRAILASITPGDWVIAISEATKRDLCEETGIDPERVFVVPLAASKDLFHPVTDAEKLSAVRARYGIPSGPYLLSLNTLEPRKNLAMVIDAFDQALKRGGVDDLSLVLVGATGWKYESIFAALDRLQVEPSRVVLTGYVDDADLAALYSGALAFIYPSFYEGFGLPPLEAMQCGVPVLTANNSSLPEVVGEAGWVVDPDDRDGFVDAVLELYGNATLRAEMSERSLARAAEFSWQRCTDETLAAFRTILNA